MKHYIKLMRVHHYIKNFLVFAALACSGQFFQPDKLFSGMLGFAAFCMVSSVVYIINDIRDVEKDRAHPTKCKRPIAAGTVSVRNACILAAALVIGAAVCNFFVFRWESTALLALYLIRILYGALATDIVISNWLYLTVIAISFYFALGKRRNELKQLGGGQTRKVLEKYPVAFLDKSMSMCLTLANAFYALWSMDANTISLYGSNTLIFTVPIVLLITMKYSLNVEGESDGDPVEVLLHDKVLLGLCVVYLATMFTILYQ